MGGRNTNRSEIHVVVRVPQHAHAWLGDLPERALARLASGVAYQGGAMSEARNPKSLIWLCPVRISDLVFRQSAAGGTGAPAPLL